MNFKVLASTLIKDPSTLYSWYILAFGFLIRFLVVPVTYLYGASCNP